MLHHTYVRNPHKIPNSGDSGASRWVNMLSAEGVMPPTPRGVLPDLTLCASSADGSSVSLTISWVLE